ncbi:MAG: DUF2141 domain-containing protein [Bacteroidia bacterium]
MKTTQHYPIRVLSIIAIAVSLTYCNSPAEKDETTSMEETTDTLIPDTATMKTNETETKTSTSEKETVAAHKPLTLIIKNLASATAPVIVGLYNSKKNFLKVEGRLKEYKFTPSGTTLTTQITDLDYGEFAMAIYQDEDSNGEINKNMIGVPTEGYAFSNNYKPRVKAPSFSDCMFVYDSSTNTVTMNMIR